MVKVNGKIIVNNDFKVEPYSDEIYFNNEKKYYIENIYI